MNSTYNFNYSKLDNLTHGLKCAVLHNEPMAKHTTFRIGGPADRMVFADSVKALSEIVQCLNEDEIPFFVLGNGSNLLISDEGIRGAVIVLSGEFKRISLTERTIECGAGVNLATLCGFARDRALSGLEFAWGIPGSVGGAVYMNAGAYDGEMKNVVVRTEHLTPSGEISGYTSRELDFSYRKSIYSQNGYIILKTFISLEKGSIIEICAKMDELMGRRKEKQPYDMPSAGSVFKRPEGAYAAALIEQCGLKGRAIGGAAVSEKHSGFIVNTGTASARDVLNLIELIRETVYREKGIELDCEIKIIG